jgi:hypothetical protein
VTKIGATRNLTLAPCQWLAANDDQGLAEALHIPAKSGISGN